MRGSRRIRVWRRIRVGLAIAVLTASLVAAAPAAAVTLSGDHPLLVVLCNFANQRVTPRPVSYYEHMFGEAGAGELGMFDFFRDASGGLLDLTGTVVQGWYTLPMTRDQWSAQGRSGNWQSCAAAAEPTTNLNRFSAIVAIFPEAQTSVAEGISATATTIRVVSLSDGDAANFPTPPFLAYIANRDSSNAEGVTVTAISGTTMSITRGPNATSHSAAEIVGVNGDLYGFLPRAVNLNGHAYTMGGVVAAHDIGMMALAHEVSHGYGFEHSRALSTQNADYHDCYDLMSAWGCVFTFEAGTPFGGSNYGRTLKGPAFNAYQLNLKGWIPTARSQTFTGDHCSERAVQMAALYHPEATGSMEVMVPAVYPITAPEGPTTGQLYTVELRSKSGWDRGIPTDSVLLHLAAGGRSYWVDRTVTGATVGHGGALLAGDDYADPGNHFFMVVNSIDPASFGAVVTLGVCTISPQLTWSGPTTVASGGQAQLAADVLTGAGKPIPNHPVDLSLGSERCTAQTDALGHAACTVVVGEAPGASHFSVSFSGDEAIGPAGTVGAVTVTPPQVTAPTLGLQVSTKTVTFGSPVTFTIDLSFNGAPVPNRAVHLESSPTGAVWTSVAGSLRATVEDGSASITIRPSATLFYRAVSESDSQMTAGVTAGNDRVIVRSRVTESPAPTAIAKTVRRGSTTTLSFTVQPTNPGVPPGKLSVQILTVNNGHETLSKTITTAPAGATGKATVKIVWSVPRGTYAVRAMAVATSANAASAWTAEQRYVVT